MRRIILVCLVSLFAFPFHAMAKVVNEDKNLYSFEMMEADLKRLQQTLPIEVHSIGKSEKGRDIWAVKLGKGQQSILLVGAHHGREWLTTHLLVKMLEQYGTAYEKGKQLGEYSTKLLDEISIWFIPMINPDGVSIQQGNLSGFSHYEKIVTWQRNNYSMDWTRWKANAKGIDLNRQYPAGWDEVKTDVSQPFYQFYKGKKPFEAVEVQALAQFTYRIEPLVAVSYHTSGREIFWHYHNKQEHMARDYELAKKTAELTGYKLSKPEKHAVGSGFTDWFITEFERPAMTIELSYLVEETNPPLSVFPEEWKRNRLVGMMLVKEAVSGIK
ncbi:M14 family zinc carboxypeptidase [Peribacillus sp. Hz7]|uniref:M14 family zinc carboxypeptidase n=1 Tax=Peribacillus sp. Hz7 TaxID=3344873 RepID=UPI0035CBE62F